MTEPSHPNLPATTAPRSHAALRTRGWQLAVVAAAACGPTAAPVGSPPAPTMASSTASLSTVSPASPTPPASTASAIVSASAAASTSSAPRLPEGVPIDPLALPGLVRPSRKGKLAALDCEGLHAEWDVTGDGDDMFPTGALTVKKGDAVVLERRPKDALESWSVDFCFDLTADGKAEIVVRQTSSGARSRHRIEVLTVDGMRSILKHAPGLGGWVHPVRLGKGPAFELEVGAGTLVDSGELVPAFAPLDTLIFALRGGRYVLAGREHPSAYDGERFLAEKALDECESRDDECRLHAGARLALTAHWKRDWQKQRARFSPAVQRRLDALVARWNKTL